MRKIIQGLAPAIILLSASNATAAPPWRVSEVSGSVRLTESGVSRNAIRGALLSSGSVIATAPGARAVIVRGEEFVVISPNSQLRVPAAAEANGVMQMIEDFGVALFKINKKATPHFGVQTPYLAAVVKGTTFTVTVGQDGGTVQVTEGAVEVSTLDGGATDLVTPGVIATVAAADVYQLRIEGNASKLLRSDKAPPAGTVTTRAPAAYRGPATTAVQVAIPIPEAARALSEVTNGLLQGSATFELAASDLRDQSLRTAQVAVRPALPEVAAPQPVPPVVQPEPAPTPTQPEPAPTPTQPEPAPTPAPPEPTPNVPPGPGGNGNATGNPGVGNNGNDGTIGNAGGNTGPQNPNPLPGVPPVPVVVTPEPTPIVVAPPLVTSPEPAPVVVTPEPAPVMVPEPVVVTPEPTPVVLVPEPQTLPPVTQPEPLPELPPVPVDNSGSGSSGSGSGSSGSGSGNPVTQPLVIVEPQTLPPPPAPEPVLEPIVEPAVLPLEPILEPILEPVVGLMTGPLVLPPQQDGL